MISLVYSIKYTGYNLIFCPRNDELPRHLCLRRGLYASPGKKVPLFFTRIWGFGCNRANSTKKRNKMEVLLTAQELAALLKISMRQLWRLRDSGTLPSPTSIGEGGRILRRSAARISKWVEDGMPNVHHTSWTPRSEGGKK